MNAKHAASRFTATKRRRRTLGALAAGTVALGIALPASASATTNGSASGAVTSQAKQAEGSIPAEAKAVPCKAGTVVITDARGHEVKVETGRVQHAKRASGAVIGKAKRVEGSIPTKGKAVAGAGTVVTSGAHKGKVETGRVLHAKRGGACDITIVGASGAVTGKAKRIEGSIPAKAKAVAPGAGTLVITEAPAGKQEKGATPAQR